MDRLLRGFLAVFIMTCLTSAPDAVAVQGKCVVGKNKCMSKKAGALLKCHQKAETPGKPADPNFGGCIDKAKAKFDGTPDPTKGCFEKLENKSPNDCVTFDDTAAAETLVDDCVDQLVAAIDPGAITQTKCGVGKKKCVAKMLKSILKCHQKAQTPGRPTDPNFGGCIDKAKAKFDGGTDPTKGCFVKLFSQPGDDCESGAPDQAAVEAIVDGVDSDPPTCVGGFIVLLETPTTTTTTTTTSSTTTTLPPCGQTVGGFCWFQGEFGENCNTVCANQGRVYDPATATYAGSGGTDAQCQAVLTAFGGGTLSYPFLTCLGGNGGFGCVRTIYGDTFRCATPVTTATAASFEIAPFCACM